VKSSRSPRDARDGQQRTGFTASLESLVATCMGCIAAVLVDEEGEAVDYAGRLPPYDVKLAAAHFQIVLRELCSAARGGAAHSVLVRAERYGYLARRLFGDYVLVLVCTPQGAFEISTRALRHAEMELSREACWPLDAIARPRWTRVCVSVGANGVPVELWPRAGARERVAVVLGRATGLGEFERGFRVSTQSGRELTLVREASGTWYADDELG
jgi:hypothetical protein